MAGFISLGCNIAAAAESTENERGFYVGGSVNRVNPQVYSWGEPRFTLGREFILLQLDQIRVDDDSDAGWNVTLGYEVNKYLAAEVSYYDFGEASVTLDYSSLLRPVKLFFYDRYNIESFGLGVSLLGTLPLTSSLDIFARGGVLFLDQDIEETAGFDAPGGRGVSRRTGDEIWMAGAGVQWAFAPRWATRLEYQLTGDAERDRANQAKKFAQVSLSVLFDF